MTGTETTADRGPHAPARAPDRRASLDRLVELLREPVDIASLVAFRVIFGLMMLVSVVRFWQRGWIEELYIQPAYHFTYWGFEWVRVWPAWSLYVHFAALAVLALCVALG